MELDLKKAFYIIIAIVLLGLIAGAIAKPIYNKINAQTTRIESVDFSTSGEVVAP